MLEAALRSGGTAGRRCVFEVFARRLPVVAAVRRRGRHRPAAGGAAALPVRRRRARRARASGWSTTPTLRWLAGLPVHRRRLGLRRGRGYFPGSPVLVVEGTFAEAVLLETLVLSVLNHDSAVAAAASRMTSAAGGPAVPGDGLAAHARGGRGGGRAGGVRRRLRRDVATSPPARGTASRRSAPRPTRSRCCTTTSGPRSRPRWRRSAPGRRCWSTPTTSPQGVRTAVEVAGTGLGAVRLDSGDLLEQAHAVRAQLDALGATGDADRRHQRPRRVRDRRAGRRAGRRRTASGTSLVTGSGAPDGRDGLQARGARGARAASWSAVAKRSVDKLSVGGRKWALRRRDAGRDRGRGGDRHRAPAEPRRTTATTGSLLRQLCRAARRWRPSRWTTPGPARGVARRAAAAARQLSRGEPVLATRYEPATRPRARPPARQRQTGHGPPTRVPEEDP